MALTLTDKICDFLVQQGRVSEEDLRKARSVYTEKGGEFTDILVKMNLLDRKDLLAAVSQIADFAPIDLTRVSVDDEILKLIPKRIASMYRVLPVSRIGNYLTVAMVDPMNIFALDDLRAITRLEVVPVIADSDDVMDAIQRFYERSAEDEISELVEGLSAERVEMVEEEKEEISSRELMRIIEETPVIKLTNLILSEAVKERASDILIEPMEKNFRVRYRIDGVLHVRHTPPKKYHTALISRLKVMSNLNIAERRLPQDGRFRLKIEERRIDFRISVIPSILGEKASIRILDKEQVTIDLARLGIKERDQKTIKTASEVPHGMILACGPTGSGKTTTLYSVLKYVDSPGKNLVTVEDPVEYEIKGINQVAISGELDLTFAGCLRSILRQDPDVIMIGEIRDFETVDIAIKAALTGHLVLSTLHTNTASGSVVRLINMGVEPFLIASSVILVIAQRLVRKLCPECRKPYVPLPEVAERYGLFDKNRNISTLYKPGGCKRCMNSGYSGRSAIIECMRITPAIKDLLFKRAQEYEIENVAVQEGMVTLRENGIENVKEGITPLEEVLRITTDTKKLNG